jgi:hypothetical protein
MTLLTQIKHIIKDSPMEPIAWELYSYRRSLQQAWVKIAASSPVANTARAFGIRHQVKLPLHKQWVKVMRNSRLELPTATGKRVLFATGYGFTPAMLALESIIAKSLRLRGVQVLSLACNKTLPACEWNKYGNHQPFPGQYSPRMFARTRLDTCRHCTQPLLDLYETIGIQQLFLNDFLRPDDVQRLVAVVDALPYERYDNFVYKNIRVSEHARSSTMRSLLRGTLQDDAYTRWLYRRYLISAMLLTDLTERMFDVYQPEHVVAVHGIYVTHGTICEVARKHSIPVVVHGIPYRKGTIWLSHNDTYHRTLVTEPTYQWENLSLTPEQEQKLDAYIDSRLSGGRDYVTYHPNPIEDREILRQELGLDKRPIIGLFTNVLWDAQLFYDYNAFDNLIDWLFQTICYFGRRSDLQLVIRIHPAEVKSGQSTKQPILAEIMARFPVLPENVKVISPESNLSSYTLADMSHATLIYGTKMGLEIAFRGIPVIVVGETLCRGKGFTYDVETKEQYFNFLDHILELPRNSSEMIVRARKYAYHLFFRRMIDFPLFSCDVVKVHDATLQFQDLNELLPGVNRNLDAICDGILNGSPFVLD